MCLGTKMSERGVSVVPGLLRGEVSVVPGRLRGEVSVVPERLRGYVRGTRRVERGYDTNILIVDFVHLFT